MHNHYFDADGVYTMTWPATPNTLPPANALRAPLPDKLGPGFAATVNAAGDGWDLLEDHRGETGYVAGARMVIDRLGPLPDGWIPAAEYRPAQDESDNAENSADSIDPDDIDAQRRAAYEDEVDPILVDILHYRVEAEAWRNAGDLIHAAAAQARVDAALAEYLEKKKRIRQRLPRRDEHRYYLTNAGTYHAEGCVHNTAVGEWLTLDEVAATNPDSKPCRSCKPLAEKKGG
ncbi:MAG: hypothetical protein LIP23_09225 [Planctomycetes bacterium]|nr:hypothetical protein [Planctomycetota bacterium]